MLVFFPDIFYCSMSPLAEHFKTLRQIHLDYAALERKKIRHHTDKCKNRNSDKHMGLIFDGMTQDTTALPHFTRKPGWLQRHKYKVHVQGVMVAGRKPKLEFAYANISNDANMSITTLHNAILGEQKLRLQEGRPLPEVLYVQADNVNSNKSKAFMAYLCHLVNLGVFKKVKVNYLLVGHTHEFIDQMFSRFSLALRHEDAFTLEQLMDVAHNSLQQHPEVVKVEGSFNWTKWFDGFLQNFFDLSFNHAFKVQKVDGSAKLFSRKYGSGPSRTWQSSALDILPSPPLGGPDVAPLTPLKPEDLDSAQFIRDKLRNTLHPNAYNGAVQDYWAEQCDFQQNLSKHVDNNDSPELPFSFHVPCAHMAPTLLTQDEALQQANPRLRELVDPVTRPIYINERGCKSAVQREARQLLLDDRFAEAMEDIKCFDPSVNGNQLLISWANGEEHDLCWFKVQYSFSGEKKISEPLHLVQIDGIDVARNEVSMKYLVPKNWTHKLDRIIAIKKAGEPGTWNSGPSAPRGTSKFNPDEYVIACENLHGDDTRRISDSFYKDLQSKLIARDMKIEAEKQQNAS